jgi:hypothetical protein
LSLMRTKGNTRSAPVWLKDFGSRMALVVFPATLDPTQFTDAGGITVTVDTGGALANATNIPVVALAGPGSYVQPLIAAGQVLIPAGSVVSFGAVGSKKFAKLTADAKAGDVALTVEALATALVAGDIGTFSRYGTEYIPSGTLVARTWVQRDASTPFGAIGSTDPATIAGEVYLTAFDVRDATLIADCELVRHNVAIAENYLPNWANYTTAQKAWLRANYVCGTGVD